MPRRPIRCRYYTDSGEPIRGGCRRIGAACNFVHPDDPAWADAEVSSSKPMNRGGDSSSSRPWGEGNRRGSAASGWDTGGNGPTSATGTSGGWDTGGGWGSSSGWGGSTSTAPEPIQRKNSSATGSWDASSIDQNQTNVNPTASKSGGDGWGASGNDSWGGSWGDSNEGGSWGAARNEARVAGWGNAKDNDNDAGSGWGSGVGGWGTGGNKKDADKATGSGWGSASAGASGGSWGNQDTNKDAGSGWGSGGGGGGGGWGAGGHKDADKPAESGWRSASTGDSGGSWGVQDTNKDAGPGLGTGSGRWEENKKDANKAATGSGWGGWGGEEATGSWGVSDPMIVDNSAEKTEPARNKGKGKAVLAPPRIRIPDKDKVMMTGTNDEPLGSNKRWGDSRSSDLATASTPMPASTPVTTTTPVDSIRVKRKRDIAFDDKAEIFKEYTKAWERGVRARFLLAEAEIKRDRWFRTQKSACYTRIGEAGRKILDGQRAECDEQVNIQREKVSAAVTSLVDFHDTIASNIDLGQRYNLGKEMEEFLTDSKAYVDEVRALIVMHVLKEKDDVQPSDQKHSCGVVAALMDSVQSQIRDFEERFEQAQTELTLRHQRDISSEINELLQVKIAESRAARQREIDRVASQPRPEVVIPPSVLKDQEAMAQQVREFDPKVRQAAEDISNLLLRVDVTTKRVTDLEQEVSANKETYEKQKRNLVAERESAERKINGELEHLRSKFTELVASKPPAEPAACNPEEKLLKTLLPTFEEVLDKFYEQEVVPTIERTQRTAIDESNRYQDEAFNMLWGKIQPAMNMVTGVSRWLDSQELRLTAPVEGDQGTGGNSI